MTENIIMNGNGFQARRSEDRITLWSEDGNEYYGDLSSISTHDDIRFAMAWYKMGLTKGLGLGFSEALNATGATTQN